MHAWRRVNLITIERHVEEYPMTRRWEFLKGSLHVGQAVLCSPSGRKFQVKLGRGCFVRPMVKRRKGDDKK